MSWMLLAGLIVLLALTVTSLASRRHQLDALRRSFSDLREAKQLGSHEARLQYPFIDLSQCIGCGLCVRACPEEGVLDLIHGQAAVIHGARCVGHGRCVTACPTAGLQVTLGDLSERRDIPALTPNNEAKHTPGLFLAGEITGFALIRTAIAHGAEVAREASHRIASLNGNRPAGPGAPLDLLIVGAGPAGISCSLTAKELGLRFLTVEQESLGGTVAKYPRRKLVMTQPVELPLYGRLRQTTYEKEELVDLWKRVVRTNDLPIETGVAFEGVTRGPDGVFTARTSVGEIRALQVCLCLGRRGSPRKLSVPGEELPKVAYSLIDAESYQGRRILIVGGGDSAVEAAIGLSEQPGNAVTLSYRKSSFFRVKSKNLARLDRAVTSGALRPLMESNVARIGLHDVDLSVNGSGHETLENDEVFVFAGGIPPFKLLERCGVSFDPEDRDPVTPEVERGSGLLAALSCALALAAAAGAFALWNNRYYLLAETSRPGSALHAALRPAGAVGLTFGIAAVCLMVFNISYLARRYAPERWLPGSLKAWMTGHIVTGILALLCVLLHSGLTARNTIGGHAFVALTLLVATGAFGRYVYAFLPRAASGRVAQLDDVRSRLATLSSEWDRAGSFGTRVQDAVESLVDTKPWRGSFLRRLGALLAGQRRLRSTLAQLRSAGLTEGVPQDQLGNVLTLARQAYRNALMAAHYEDLRGLLATWRYFHRWVGLLMFLLAALHVATAVRFADLAWPLVGGAGR